ncbi:unnamed protein product [Acanthosepion pharaonis]|uniref:Uncharacterized protein n=1 Tax=Acanthosepion pharaonis TaxID=158019 RepID=A0A812E295_ACAPH|nr:unnamed protein product [Sepia pharaonis]
MFDLSFALPILFLVPFFSSFFIQHMQISLFSSYLISLCPLSRCAHIFLLSLLSVLFFSLSLSPLLTATCLFLSPHDLSSLASLSAPLSRSVCSPFSLCLLPFLALSAPLSRSVCSPFSLCLLPFLCLCLLSPFSLCLLPFRSVCSPFSLCLYIFLPVALSVPFLALSAPLSRSVCSPFSVPFSQIITLSLTLLSWIFIPFFSSFVGP